jgi:uncharacterized damage-inducible protein DinB
MVGGSAGNSAVLATIFSPGCVFRQPRPFPLFCPLFPTRDGPKTEAQYVAAFIERNARLILAKLAERTDEQLNQPLPIPDANTLFAIATHTVGMAEFWVLALVGGQMVERDRPAEFRATGGGVALRERYERFIHNMHQVLTDLPTADMTRVVTPPAAFRLTGGFRPDQPLTVRDCLLHVVEHTANHLGHVELTCDLFDQQAAQG